MQQPKSSPELTLAERVADITPAPTFEGFYKSIPDETLALLVEAFAAGPNRDKRQSEGLVLMTLAAMTLKTGAITVTLESLAKNTRHAGIWCAIEQARRQGYLEVEWPPTIADVFILRKTEKGEQEHAKLDRIFANLEERTGGGGAYVV